VEGHQGRPVGVNIAKTHDPTILGAAAVEDFTTSFRLLAPLADFVVLNVSCPNTTEGKTFEERSGGFFSSLWVVGEKPTDLG